MSSLVHVWNYCFHCGARPIVGPRFSCGTCPAGPENDLCERCHSSVARLSPGAAGASRHAGHRFVSHVGYPATDYDRYLTVPFVSMPAPAVPRAAIVRPEFRCGTDSFIGSYGFVVAVEDGGPAFLLTALHVLDEVAKAHRLSLAVPGGSLPLSNLIDRVTLYDVMAERWIFAEIGSCDRMVPLPQALVRDLEPFSQGDVAAFHVVPRSSTHALRLGVSPPPGAPIWQSAPDATGSRMRAGVVVESTPELFVFRLEDAAPPRSSGSPLLDCDGRVVGIDAGGGYLAGCHFGHGSHLEGLEQLLVSQLGHGGDETTVQSDRIHVQPLARRG